MKVGKNSGGVNRLKITLDADDTYTMYFYKQTMTRSFDFKISKETRFEGVYFDMLQDLFTDVTGIYTKLF